MPVRRSAPFLYALLLVGLLCSGAGVQAATADPGSYLAVNCGNSGEPDKPGRFLANLARLHWAKDHGVGWARCSGGPLQWHSGGRPRPDRFEAVIRHANTLGVKVYLFLEYRPDLDGGSVNDYDWQAVGRSFAEHFGTRVAAYGIMNEVDHDEAVRGGLRPEHVLQAVRGFVAGVKGVNAQLLTCSPSIGGTPMTPGQEIPFLQALAPLFNNGQLDILNLHNYHDCRPDRPHYSCFDQTGSQWAAHKNFITHKRDAGITANVRFATGEFNYRNWDGTDKDRQIGFMTTLWAQLSVTGQGGVDDRVGVYSGPFNIFDSRPPPRQIVMAREWTYDSDDPSDYTWTPNEKGQVLQFVLQLTRGMRFIRTDAHDKGLMILRGAGRKLWVWHNRHDFSSLHGEASLELSGIPRAATQLKVYAAGDQLAAPSAIIALDGSGRQRLQSAALPAQQTLMFVVESDADGAVVGDLQRPGLTDLPPGSPSGLRARVLPVP